MIAYFWSLVVKGDGCWIWTGTTNRKGYGVFVHDGKQYLAARFALSLVEEIHEGHQALHHCDNPPCVRNDGHLFSGTIADNQHDKKSKGRAAKGERNGGGGKLGEREVIEIRQLGGRFEQRDLGRRFGVSHTMIGKILRRELWQHVA